MKTVVKPGQLCPTCGLRKDEMFADGHKILYGQGLGRLVVTEDGRKFIAQTLVADLMDDIIQVAAHVVADPKMQIDDRAYASARKLLSMITEIPDRIR